MKLKKQLPKISKPKDDKVVISSEYYTNEIKPSFLCSFCNQTLVRLTDSSLQNTSFWCRQCSFEWNPEDENLRRESKITVPDRSIEPAVSTTPGIPDISIHKEPELKGSFKALKDRGLKITNYKEDVG
jgi:uncharacterized Zn ribbon protein